MNTYTKDQLIQMLEILKDKPAKSATKAVLIERLKGVVCDGDVPGIKVKECPEGKVINPKTGRCIKAQKKPAHAPAPAAKPVAVPKPAPAAKPALAPSKISWTDKLMKIFDKGNDGALSYTTVYIYVAYTSGKGDVRVEISGELENIALYKGKTVKPRVFDMDRTGVTAFIHAIKGECDAGAQVTIRSLPSDFAWHTDKPGGFGKAVLRDVFGAFLRDECGVAQGRIKIVEEAVSEDMGVKEFLVSWK